MGRRFSVRWRKIRELSLDLGTQGSAVLRVAAEVRDVRRELGELSGMAGVRAELDTIGEQIRAEARQTEGLSGAAARIAALYEEKEETVLSRSERGRANVLPR